MENNSPILPPPSDAPATTPPQNNKKKLLLAIGIPVAVLLLMVGLGLYFAMSQSERGSDKPKATINIGDARYMDACQLLPSAKVSEYFGAFNDGSYVVQDFVESTMKSKTASPRVECAHNYGDDLGTSVMVRVEYFKDRETALTEWEKPLKIASGEYRRDAEIDRGDADSAELDKALAVFDEIIQGGLGYLEATGSGARVQELDSTIVFVPYRMWFTKVVDNSLVYVRYDKAFDRSNPFTPAALKPHLPAIKKTFATIESNAKNVELSQEPLGATPLGQDPIGNTKIFAPCDAFSAETFKKATSNPSDPELQQTTAKRKTPSGDTHFNKNSCERHAKNIGGNADGSDNAYVDITYRRTAELAKDMYDKKVALYKKYPDQCSVKDIETPAGSAVVVMDKDQATESCENLDYAYVHYGPYYITINFSGERNKVEKHYENEAYGVVANDILEYIKDHQ
jgi:hypothetical protein